MTYIPDRVRVKVWTEAAGRCQFNQCNKPLWYNELTLSERNFSEMAHIIGASEGGPRGSEQLSDELAQDPENIMLLCDRCHKEIDDLILKDNYSVVLLKKMKTDHTNRVRMLLDQSSKRTRPLIFTTDIGGQKSMFGERSIQSALLPDYPDKISENWFKIEIGKFERTKLIEWESVKNKIDDNFESVERALSSGSINHLSVFGLAAQPLLMWLGRKLGDKISAQIFEPRRTDDLEKKWNWDIETETKIEFNVSKIKESKTKNVILLLALSDYLGNDKYANMLDEDAYIYQITIDNPTQGFLTQKTEKALFIKTCRSLLNRIQLEVGKDCIIHTLPAMPASLAIEFGRLIQPTKDPVIWVYENISGIKPEKIIELI